MAKDDINGVSNPAYDKAESSDESEPSTSGARNEYEINSIHSDDSSVKDANDVKINVNGDAKVVPNGGSSPFSGSGMEQGKVDKEMELHGNTSITLLRYRNVGKEEPDSITRPDRGNVEIERELLNQQEFDEQYKAAERPYKTIRQWASEMKTGCECNARCFKKKMANLFPIVKLPKYYDFPDDLISDTIAGLTVGIMQIPQGMAYATLANLPPEYGLYTSLWPVLLYAIMGTSRHVSVGTFAVISLMMGGAIEGFDCQGKFGQEGTTMSPDWNETMTTSDPSDDPVATCRVAVAVAVTFVGGLLQLILGILRMGFVTIYLSESFTRGFTTGAAIHVFSSQINDIFGINIGSYYGPWKLIYTYRDLFKYMGQTNVAALVLSIICLVIIWCTKEYVNPIIKKRSRAFIPIDLVIVILGTVASVVADFENKYEMEVVGYIPQGIPKPVVPKPEYMADVIGDAIIIAIVSFAISVSMTQLFAKKHNYEYDSNQELIAHGTTNMICSTLNCYLMSVSLSRSAVSENTGCKSPITAIWAAGLMLIVILFIATYFQQLPSCVLASIIVVALKGMFMQFKDLPKYWKINKTDFWVWLVTFVAVVLFDVAYGLVVGVAFSLLTVIAVTQSPYSTCEGQINDTEIYRDAGVYSEAREMEGVKIFRFDGSIYFASKQFFIDSVYEKTGCDARAIKLKRGKVERKRKKAEKQIEKAQKKLEKETGNVSQDLEIDLEKQLSEFVTPMPHITYLIIDCTTMGYLDDSGVQGIKQVCSEYNDIGVTVFLAGCKAGVREMLVRGGFHDKFDRDIMFPTVHDAVLATAKLSKKTEGDGVVYEMVEL